MQTAGADSIKLVACKLLNIIFSFNNYSNTYNEQTFLIQHSQQLFIPITSQTPQAFTEAVTHCTIETCNEPHKTVNYDPSEH